MVAFNKGRNGFLSCGVVASLVLGATAAQGQDEGGQGGLEYGLSSELRYDDNIYLAEDNEVDSMILEASPWVRGTLYNKGNTYQLGYKLSHAEYFDSSDDNYDNHELELNLNHRFTDRHAVAVKAAYRALTEQRGTGFSEEPNETVGGPDDYDRRNVDLIYYLGVPTADLRFELSAKYNELDFDSSYVGDSRDYDQIQLGILSRYRIGARTDLLLEYRNLDVSYDNIPLDFNGQQLSLDSNEDYYLVGLAWEFTAKTRGEVKVGHSARDYDGDDFSSSNLHWEAEVEWRPKSYSRFQLRTARASVETYGSGLFVNTQKYELAWNHAWSGFLSSELATGMMDDEYEASSRDDERLFWKAQLGYEYASWLNFKLGYQYRENDSTLDLVNYEQNKIFLSAELKL